MDLGPVFTVLFWCMQALTAAVLLADAYFKMRATHGEFLQRKPHTENTPPPNGSKDPTVPSLENEKQEQQGKNDVTS